MVVGDLLIEKRLDVFWRFQFADGPRVGWRKNIGRHGFELRVADFAGLFIVRLVLIFH